MSIIYHTTLARLTTTKAGATTRIRGTTGHKDEHRPQASNKDRVRANDHERNKGGIRSSEKASRLTPAGKEGEREEDEAEAEAAAPPLNARERAAMIKRKETGPERRIIVASHTRLQQT